MKFRVSISSAIFGSLFLFPFLVCSTALADTVRVKVSGVDAELFENIAAFLTILKSPESGESRLPLISLINRNAIPPVSLTERQLKRGHRLAPDEIRSALQPFGYYDPEISSTLNKQQEEWIASYDISPGEPTMVQTVDLQLEGSGKEEATIRDVFGSTNLRVDTRLLHQDYTLTKNSVLKAALEAGYLDAQFSKSEIKVDRQQKTAGIALHLDTGPLYYFGAVDIQQSALERTIVERLLPFEEGERFDSTKLIKLQLSLEDTEYFREVDVQAKRDASQNNRIPIVVAATAAKPRRYSIGAGYGTDTGPRVNLGINILRVNKKGHQFRTDLRVSTISSSLQSQYTIPVDHGSNSRIAITANATAESIADIDTESVLLGVARFESWRGFQRQTYLNYEREIFDIGEGQQKIELLVPGIALSRKKADDLVYPKRGYSVNLDLNGGSESVASDTNFIQASLSAATIWPLGSRGRLLLRGEYGATDADDFSLLPISRRFFAGGDRSVRGYDYQELSPVDDAGSRIGGQYLTLLSIEVDYLLYGNYGVAGFIDAGNADSEVLPSLEYAVGAGIRYRSPIGMIRLDIAHPVDNNDSSYRLHVSIGADL